MKKIIMLIIFLLLNGCYNYNELNDVAIATAIGIDKDNEYKISILIENLKKNEDKSDTIIYDGKGNTIYEAFKDASLKISKKINLSHIEILLLSENICKDTNSTIDFLFRYPQIKNNFLLFVTKNTKPKDILNLKIPNQSVAINIKKNIYKNDKMQGSSYPVNFTDYVKTITTKGIDPLIPYITLENKNIKMGNFTIINKNNLIIYSNYDESIGIKLLNNKSNLIYINEKNTIVEISEIKTKWKIINDELIINLNSKGTIIEVKNNINLNDNKTLNDIKENTINKIKGNITSAINLSKNNNIDFLGINNYLYKNKKKNINLKNLNYKIYCDLDIESSGTLNNTMGENNEN